MVNWSWLVGEAVLGALLPDSYSRYRRPIAEGLSRFLSRLPAPDVARILADQAALPVSTSVEERLVTLAEACPVLHKLGQVLARDRRLATELRRHLQRLESLPAATSQGVIEDALRCELGPPESLGVRLKFPALAEASVAVVVPFESVGEDQDLLPRRGVFKVLKPEIEERMARELDVLQEVGSFLDDRCNEFGIPRLDYGEVFDQVREKLGMEVDLRGEQRHLRQASETYAYEPEVLIPRLYPFSTSRVTAMERVDGHKVTEPGDHPPRDRRRLAELIVEAMIAGPIWSPAAQAVFHADPHAGNLFVTPDRRLAILDWSLVGVLGECDRESMSQILLGALMLDETCVRSALCSLSIDGRVDQSAIACVVRDAFRKIRLGNFPGFQWMTDLLDDAALRARFRPLSDLVLFRKALLTIEGVLHDVSIDVKLDDLLPSLFLRRLVSEWPRRMLAPPRSRAFETRLSNEDITLLLLRLPSTPVRALIENGLEALRTYSGPA